MTKQELITEVSINTEFSKKDVATIVENVFETITNTLKKGEGVGIYAFGKFDIRERAERIGRNPKTGEEVTISASKSVGFKPAKALKDGVNE